MIKPSRAPNSKCITVVLAAMLSLPFVSLNKEGGYDAVIGWMTLAIGLVSVLRVRRNWYLLTLYSLMLWFNYSAIQHLYLKHSTGLYATYAGSAIASQGVNILCVFSLMMLAAAPNASRSSGIRSIVAGNRRNRVIVWVIAAVCMFVLVFGFGRPDVAGVRGSTTTFYEYSTVLIIIGFWYSGESWLYRGMLVMVSALFALQDFVYGGRATGLQLVLIIVFSLYAEKLSFRRVAVPGIMFFLLMQAIGMQRARLSLSLDTFSQVIDSLAGGGDS